MNPPPPTLDTEKTHLLSKDILKKASQGPTAKEDPSLSLGRKQRRKKLPLLNVDEDELEAAAWAGAFETGARAKQQGYITPGPVWRAEKMKEGAFSLSFFLLLLLLCRDSKVSSSTSSGVVY